MTTKTMLAALLVAVIGLGAACAAVISPAMTNQQMAEAELAIRRAEREGASGSAPDLLTMAREALDNGRQSAVRGDREKAQARFLEAKAYAEAAESKTRFARADGQAKQVTKEADDLEAKAKELRSRAR
jgi:hypothetical protein